MRLLINGLILKIFMFLRLADYIKNKKDELKKKSPYIFRSQSKSMASFYHNDKDMRGIENNLTRRGLNFTSAQKKEKKISNSTR